MKAARRPEVLRIKPRQRRAAGSACRVRSVGPGGFAATARRSAGSLVKESDVAPPSMRSELGQRTFTSIKGYRRRCPGATSVEVCWCSAADPRYRLPHVHRPAMAARLGTCRGQASRVPCAGIRPGRARQRAPDADPARNSQLAKRLLAACPARAEQLDLPEVEEVCLSAGNGRSTRDSRRPAAPASPRPPSSLRRAAAEIRPAGMPFVIRRGWQRRQVERSRPRVLRARSSPGSATNSRVVTPRHHRRLPCLNRRAHAGEDLMHPAGFPESC